MANSNEALKISDFQKLVPSPEGLIPEILVPVAYNGANYSIRVADFVSLVTKTRLGLERVDNTPDAEKPVSTEMARALAYKANTEHNHAATDLPWLDEYLRLVPVSKHTHSSLSDVEGLTQALEGKISVGYKFDISEITGLADVLRDKAEAVHEHSIGDVVGLSTVLQNIWMEMNRKANAQHTHAVADIPDFTAKVMELIGQYSPPASVVAGEILW